MTIESDLTAGAPDQSPPRVRKKSGAPPEPPAIQITMPKQNATGTAAGQPRAQSTSMDTIEGLLGKLMGRLDESDQHYNDALDELNQRLNELSQKANSARGTHPDNSGAALDRVREQASSLAAQVNEASAAYKAQHSAPPPGQEQRMGDFSRANNDGPNPYFGDPRLNDDFAEVTERLERSLAARAPASEFDILTHRMDDLGRRFELALATKNDMTALHSIESQLNALTAGFADARQVYARVEAIEGHLASLMKWARSTGSPDHGGGNDRLDAIDQALQALNRNAHEMDARTAGTLEAMNEALHSLATNMATQDAPHDYPDDATLAGGHEEPPQAAEPRPSPEDYAEAWIDETSGPDNAPRKSSREAASAADRLGATIPDYQPAPGHPGRSNTLTRKRPDVVDGAPRGRSRWRDRARRRG